MKKLIVSLSVLVSLCACTHIVYKDHSTVSTQDYMTHSGDSVNIIEVEDVSLTLDTTHGKISTYYTDVTRRFVVGDSIVKVIHRVYKKITKG